MAEQNNLERKETIIAHLESILSNSDKSYDTDRIRSAMELAISAHDGQFRKSGEEYVCHPLHVACILVEIGMDTDTVIAALLHDVVEDAGVTLDEVEARFGKRVRELVAAETEDKREERPAAETWRIRKEESLALLAETDDIDVLMVWLGDKLANMRSIYRDWKIEGHAMWQRFNQKDVREQAWYYGSIVKLTERLSDTSAWIEYKALAEIVFGKGE